MIYFQLRSHDMYSKQRSFGTLQVSDGGFIRAQQGWLHKKRFLERFELLYVTKGTLYLSVSNKPITVSENQLIVLSPYQTLQGSRSSQEEVAFYWVDFMTDQTQALIMPPLIQPVSVFNQSEVLPLFNMLCEVLAGDVRQSDIQEALVMLILYTTGKNKGNENPQRSAVNEILAFIDGNLSEPLTTQTVATAMNYHKDYVSRIIQKATGMPLKEYINHRKMEAARTLLRTSAYSIDEIAGLIGYADGNLFTKFFTYHQHISPSVYRKGI